jgi:hypothetical protein
MVHGLSTPYEDWPVLLSRSTWRQFGGATATPTIQIMYVLKIQNTKIMHVVAAFPSKAISKYFVKVVAFCFC